MSIAERARAELRSLRPYDAAEQLDGTIRLNANEAPYPPSTSDFRRPLNRYPEVRPRRLRAALADYYGVPAEQLLVTRGSSEAIDLVLRCFCRAGRDNVVTPSPTFTMYRHYALIQDTDLREVTLDPTDGFALNAADVIDACDEDTRLVFLCSPNNPTGTVVPAGTLAEILESLRGRAAVVVDEAYGEFSPGPSALTLLDEFDNLLVLRTLSKALGFAGVRCGAVIGPADVVGMLDAVLAPYAMATPVVECVEDALAPERLSLAALNVHRITEERERLASALRQLPSVAAVYPSGGNFLLTRFRDVDAVLARARSERILLRHFGGELADCLRITVGLPEENDRLLASLQSLPD